MNIDYIFRTSQIYETQRLGKDFEQKFAHLVVRECLAAFSTHRRASYLREEVEPSDVVEVVVLHRMGCRVLPHLAFEGDQILHRCVVAVSSGAVVVSALRGTRLFGLHVLECHQD